MDLPEPGPQFQPGERTGHYRSTGDALLTDTEGNSAISFKDYAVALLDEIERPGHIKQRVGVAY